MVNAIQGSGGPKPVNTEIKSPSKKGRESMVEATQGEQVELHMKDLQETIASSPEINQNRIEQIRQQLRSGEYKINSFVIAEKLTKEFQHFYRTEG